MRRFNYTGRRKIPERCVEVTLIAAADGALSFSLVLDLKEVLPPLPEGCALIVEAYDGSLFERFDFGAATTRMEVKGTLKSFVAPQNPLFRLKLVEASDPRGQIAAHARSIRAAAPGQEGRARSLLHVTCRRLDGEVFRVEFPSDGHDYPTLVINDVIVSNEDVGARSLAKHPAFVSLVMPQALREVLTRLLLIDHQAPPPEDDTWRGKWARFAETLVGSPLPDENNEEEILNFISKAAAAFAHRICATERFKMVVNE
ncbi:MAG: hypothetical protein Q8N23_06500 [Archangium sp.]|nr:hypothetical protein [Archangium sp.]MDP3570699.1 hypothetical protein [Archangium sp.]